MHIDILHLDTRTKNLLLRAGINTTEQLAARTAWDLAQINGIGTTTALEVMQKILRYTERRPLSRKSAKPELYHEYTRQDVHDIFSPETPFTAGAGLWGLQGIVRIPRIPGDYVFFVTFGQTWSNHKFDEGVTTDGILSWQSQPSQDFASKQIQEFIRHDAKTNNIHLLLRKTKRAGTPYTYLGKLAYKYHDPDREKPVYFRWGISPWPPPKKCLDKLDIPLRFPMKAEGWHVRAGTGKRAKAPNLLEFYLDEVDETPLRMSVQQAKRILQALSGDSQRFERVLRAFVDGRNWAELCSTGSQYVPPASSDKTFAAPSVAEEPPDKAPDAARSDAGSSKQQNSDNDGEIDDKFIDRFVGHMLGDNDDEDAISSNAT